MGDARPMMGTEVSVWFWSDDAESDNALVEAVFAEASRIDRLMSTYRDESKISEINRDAAEHPVAAGSELYELIEKSIEVSRLTDGAFDITYESVGQHYNFRERERPDSDTVASELEKLRRPRRTRQRRRQRRRVSTTTAAAAVVTTATLALAVALAPDCHCCEHPFSTWRHPRAWAMCARAR